MKYVRVGVATLIFVTTLAAVHYLHVRFFNVEVVLYAAIFDAVIATALAAGIVVWLDYFSVLERFEKTQLVVIWLLLGYAFAISVPAVVDRSLSLYILEKLQQRGGAISLDGMPSVFVEEYLPEHRLVDVRMTEQMQSGTIVIENGCVKLTPRGRLVASFGRFYRQNFLPKRRLLMGEYTDALTDPFRNSVQRSDYACD